MAPISPSLFARTLLYLLFRPHTDISLHTHWRQTPKLESTDHIFRITLVGRHEGIAISVELGDREGTEYYGDLEKEEVSEK